MTNAEKFHEVFGDYIYGDVNLDKDHRGFIVTNGEKPWECFFHDWLFKEYEEPVDTTYMRALDAVKKYSNKKPKGTLILSTKRLVKAKEVDILYASIIEQSAYGVIFIPPGYEYEYIPGGIDDVTIVKKEGADE